jgi:hypothetical protein
VRPDQTDPGMNTNMRNEATGRENPGREVPVRNDASGRDVPVRGDASDGNPMSRRERAGSPNPKAMEGAPSWQDIKSRFVDDPQGAIAAAEELVRLAMERRIRALKDEMTAMCARDTNGNNDESSSTEGLRTRLIRYQEYCEQLGRSTLH